MQELQFDKPTLLRTHGIDKRFNDVKVLSQAHLEVTTGEVHVLLGENGAGKSTFCKILAGHLQADFGTIEFQGKKFLPSTPDEARQQGIAMINQELSLIPDLSTAENILLGVEPTRFGIIDTKELNLLAQQAMMGLSLKIAPKTRVRDLSVAQQQMVEIAKAMHQQPRLLIMDEPTAALADHEVDILFRVIRCLCATGVSVIYISHRMKEILALGDRVTVMRDGQTIATKRLQDTNEDELVTLMVGRTIAEQMPKRKVQRGAKMLQLKNVVLRPGLKPFDLELYRGEVLGVAGLMGSGRTSLLRRIFGVNTMAIGTVCVEDKLVARHPKAAIAAGIALVPEDRKQQGLVLKRSVRENMSLSRLDKLSTWGFIRYKLEKTLLTTYQERLQIRTPSLELKTATLSGGNQQKVVLAKWLLTNCKILLLDEPTRGIDVGAKSEFYHLLGELVAQGMAVIYVSSDLTELLGLADRTLVIHEGELRGILNRDDATQENVMGLAVGSVDRFGTLL